jgi:hypothetical protein
VAAKLVRPVPCAGAHLHHTLRRVALDGGLAMRDGGGSDSE